MSTPQLEPTHIDLLSRRVMLDMRQRGLSPGERYLTTNEVSRMLGVRKAVANKALRKLAEQRVLIRRQRSGTFVGPAFDQPVTSRVQVVHVLLPNSNSITRCWAVGAFTRGFVSEFPDVNLQFSFVPEKNPVGYVDYKFS